MSPVVLAEIFSDPGLSSAHESALRNVPLLSFPTGFWERAGRTRASLLRRGIKPKLGDTLIAQLCIDHNVPLLTRDRDFSPFARFAGLRLLV